MPKKIKTAKGEIIDLELYRIKQSLSTSPTSVEVEARERFIENKMKRRLKKEKNKMLENMKLDKKEEPVKEDVAPTNTDDKKRKLKKGATDVKTTSE